MIDKRAKNAGEPRKRNAPRGAEPRARHSAPTEAADKPRRFTGDAGSGKPAKSDLHRKPKPRKQDTRPPRDGAAGMRIAKVMARAGLCSRRDAETWIAEGRVLLNGAVLTSPATNIGPQDEVIVDGQALASRERTRLFLFHKPRGLVTTEKDPEGRQTIFDYLHEHWRDGPRVISIGRLDINTEGLLLLTNDGGLARVLELPSTGWMRRYRVRANGKTDQAILDRLRAGITVDGIDYAGIEASLDRVQGDNVWLTLALREGKNREIKRVLEHIGLYVNRLIRLSFGPFQLGELPEGKVEEVRTRVLRDQLGPALADEADADFDSPIGEPQRETVPAAHGREDRAPRTPRPRSDARPARGGESRGRESRNKDQRQPAARDSGTRDSGNTQRPDGTQRKGSMQRKDSTQRQDRTKGNDRKQTREPQAPVEPSFKPRGPRKHISALRATTPSKERKRTVLGETADRKGRTVVVEVKAKTTPRKAPEEPAQDKRERRGGRPEGRTERPPARSRPQEPHAPASKQRNAGKAARPDFAKPTRDAKPASRKAPSRNAPATRNAPAKTAGRAGTAGKPARPGKPGRPQRPR